MSTKAGKPERSGRAARVVGDRLGHLEQVGAGAERLAGTGEHDRADRVVGGRGAQGVGRRVIERLVERVRAIGPIEGDEAGAVVVVDLQHGRQPTASISDTNSTAASPTGCHLWCVPRCTTASPGPITTGSVPGSASSSRPDTTMSTSMVAVVCHPAAPGSCPAGRRTQRKATPPPRGSSTQPPSGSPPCSGDASGPPDCQSSTSATPSSAPGESAHGGEPSVERVRRAVLAGGGHEPPGTAVAGGARRRQRHGGIRRRRGVRPDHAHDVRAGCVARHPPPVRVAALHDDVARAELVLAVVEAEHDATVEHDHEVEGVGGVHAGSVGVVAVDPDPVAATGEADQPHRATAGRWLQGQRTRGDVAAVVDGRRRAVEPQPVREPEAVRLDRPRWSIVRTDHVPPVRIMTGDDPTRGEVHGPGRYARLPGPVT